MGEAVEKITEPFQLEVNYAYTDISKVARSEYFLIDVVSLEKLPEFLANIAKTDVGVISEHIRWEQRNMEAQRQNRENRGSRSTR